MFLEVGRERAGVRVVERCEQDLGLVVLEAGVRVLNVGDHAAAIVCGLDADAGGVAVGSIVRRSSCAGNAIAGQHVAVEEHVADAGLRVAADGLAVSGEEVVIGDGDLAEGAESAAPTATLSSPSEIQERVMVKFCALPGSMPSVLRELVGVMILMSQAVKLETAPVEETWKSGELRSVIL